MGNSHGNGHEEQQHYHHHGQHPPSWVQSMPRDMYHQRHSPPGSVPPNHMPQQVKVLPELKGGPRLRSTNNGQILQSGGTISVKNPGLQRSRSVSAPHHYDQSQPQQQPSSRPMTTFQPQFLKVRSSTQINMAVRQSPSREGFASSKRFGSESDIKEKLAMEMSQQQAKGGSKLKIGNNKKRRAPDVPVVNKVI